MDVSDVESVASTVDFVFSAVDMSKDEIKAIEEAYAVFNTKSQKKYNQKLPIQFRFLISAVFDSIIHFMQNDSRNKCRHFRRYWNGWAEIYFSS